MYVYNKNIDLIIFLCSHSHYFSLLLLVVFVFSHSSPWLYFSPMFLPSLSQAAVTLSPNSPHMHVSIYRTQPVAFTQRLTSLNSLGTPVHDGHTELNVPWRIYFWLFNLTWVLVPHVLLISSWWRLPSFGGHLALYVGWTHNRKAGQTHLFVLVLGLALAQTRKPKN